MCNVPRNVRLSTLYMASSWFVWLPSKFHQICYLQHFHKLITFSVASPLGNAPHAWREISKSALYFQDDARSHDIGVHSNTSTLGTTRAAHLLLWIRAFRCVFVSGFLLFQTSFTYDFGCVVLLLASQYFQSSKPLCKISVPRVCSLD